MKKVLNCFVGVNFLPAHIFDSLQNRTKASILNGMDLLKYQKCVKFFGKHGCTLVADLAYVIVHHLKLICPTQGVCFPVNFVKFSRTPFFTQHMWLLRLW